MSYLWFANHMTAKEVVQEAIRAEELHGRFNSPAEFYGVMAEEFNKEFLDAMHANDLPQMRKEAVQIAAVALRFVKGLDSDQEGVNAG